MMSQLFVRYPYFHVNLYQMSYHQAFNHNILCQRIGTSPGLNIPVCKLDFVQCSPVEKNRALYLSRFKRGGPVLFRKNIFQIKKLNFFIAKLQLQLQPQLQVGRLLCSPFLQPPNHPPTRPGKSGES